MPCRCTDVVDGRKWCSSDGGWSKISPVGSSPGGRLFWKVTEIGRWPPGSSALSTRKVGPGTVPSYDQTGVLMPGMISVSARCSETTYLFGAPPLGVLSGGIGMGCRNG